MDVFELIEQQWYLGVPAGFFLGVLLGVNPLALPMLGTAVALGGSGELGARGAGVRVAAAFGAGMVVAYTALGVVAGRVDQVNRAVFRPYASVGYIVLATVLLGVAAFLLLRPSAFCAACAKPAKRNPTMLGAFLAGIPGGFVNCPACAGVVLGVAASAAVLGNPFYSSTVMFALGVGHAAVLTGLAWLITRNRRFSLGWLSGLRVVAALVLVAIAAYFFWVGVQQGFGPGPRLV